MKSTPLTQIACITFGGHAVLLGRTSIYRAPGKTPLPPFRLPQ